MARERVAHARWAVHQFAATIGAPVIQRLCRGCAECAFERANERARLIGGQVRPAALAVRAHLKHC
jgi:hypothetical protein